MITSVPVPVDRPNASAAGPTREAVCGQMVHPTFVAGPSSTVPIAGTPRAREEDVLPDSSRYSVASPSTALAIPDRTSRELCIYNGFQGVYARGGATSLGRAPAQRDAVAQFRYSAIPVSPASRAESVSDPAQTDATGASLRAPVDIGDSADPSVDWAGEVSEGNDAAYQPMQSTPDQVAEALAFFKEQKASETEGQKARATKLRSTVFSILQYRVHPDTGRVMVTQEQLDGLKTTLEADEVLNRWADIWHRNDVFDEADVTYQKEHGRTVKVGDPKPVHCHVVIQLKAGCDKPIRWISERAKIPAGRIRVPKETAAAEGRAPERGRYGSDRAFFDYVQYLPHEGKKQQHKHQYSRSEIRATFDVNDFLDSGRPGGSGHGGEMKSRVRKLRRLVDDGVTLDELHDIDYDAYAEDLPRLEKLRQTYLNNVSEAEAARVGQAYRKSLVVVTGDKRQGKDVLAGELCLTLQSLADKAGQHWEIVKPPGKNALEEVGQAQLVHHEDIRYNALPAYDEALRYFDPNQAIAVAARFHNRSAPTPRVVVCTSTETLLSLGYTFRRRCPTDVLVDMAADPKRKGPDTPLDIDEFLLRIGWFVTVWKPDDIADDDLKETRRRMLVSVYRVRRDPGYRVEDVCDRRGRHVGRIMTEHDLEPVAVIRGAQPAALFLSASILTERDPDIVAAMPDCDMSDLLTQKAALEAQSRAEEAERRQVADESRRKAELESEAAHAEAKEAETRKLKNELARRQEERRICTCSDPDWYKGAGGFGGPHAGHEDTCPLLTDKERADRQRQRDLHLSRFRAGGLLLTPRPGSADHTGESTHLLIKNAKEGTAS